MLSGKSGECFISNSLSAEMEVAKAGMELAKEKGWDKVVFETDSLELFESVQDETRAPWYAEAQARELAAVMSSFPSWSFSLARRCCNSAADWVAKATRDGILAEDWLENIPLGLDWILSLEGLLDPP